MKVDNYIKVEVIENPPEHDPDGRVWIIETQYHFYYEKGFRWAMQRFTQKLRKMAQHGYMHMVDGVITPDDVTFFVSSFKPVIQAHSKIIREIALRELEGFRVLGGVVGQPSNSHLRYWVGYQKQEEEETIYE
jgi:hypothetical protein